MSKTERDKYRAVLESREAELAGRLGNRDGIVIEKAADPFDEIQSAGERSSRFAICIVNRICSGVCVVP